MLLGLASATVFRRRVVRHLRVSRAVVLSAQVRCGCVGPQYVVPTLGGGEGWVGRPLNALIDRAVSMAGSGFAGFAPTSAPDLSESNRRTEHLDPRNERSSMRR